MRLNSSNLSRPIPQLAFTLLELLIAMSIGLVLAGTVVLLLVQGSLEQRRGYADTTVEESAYILQAKITNVLRRMSAGQGLLTLDADLVPSLPSPAWQAITGWQANTDSTTTRQRISFDPDSGTVTFTPDTTAPANQTVWLTSGPKLKLKQLYFRKSLNPDNTLDSTLVNVYFEMDDNGYSQQGPDNNPADVLRSFSVKMRCD